MFLFLNHHIIIFSIIIAVGFFLVRIVRSVRQGTHKSGGLAGVAVAMTVLFGVFRDTTPQDKKKITIPTSKKGPGKNE